MYSGKTRFVTPLPKSDVTTSALSAIILATRSLTTAQTNEKTDTSELNETHSAERLDS